MHQARGRNAQVRAQFEQEAHALDEEMQAQRALPRLPPRPPPVRRPQPSRRRPAACYSSRPPPLSRHAQRRPATSAPPRSSPPTSRPSWTWPAPSSALSPPRRQPTARPRPQRLPLPRHSPLRRRLLPPPRCSARPLRRRRGPSRLTRSRCLGLSLQLPAALPGLRRPNGISLARLPATWPLQARTAPRGAPGATASRSLAALPSGSASSLELFLHRFSGCGRASQLASPRVLRTYPRRRHSCPCWPPCLVRLRLRHLSPVGGCHVPLRGSR